MSPLNPYSDEDRNQCDDDGAACNLESPVDADGAESMPCNLGTFLALDELKEQSGWRDDRVPKTHPHYEFNPS